MLLFILETNIENNLLVLSEIKRPLLQGVEPVRDVLETLAEERNSSLRRDC